MKSKIDERKKNRLNEIYKVYFNDQKVQRMKEIPMHFGSNCFLHSFKVARLTMKKAAHRKNIDLEALLTAAILHDYYLYDWRVDKSKKRHHLSRHPHLAAVQAEEDFGVSKLSQEIMESHMWPVNFKKYPKTKEAKILSLCDKSIAIREFLTSSKHKKKHMERYLKDISSLF